MTNGSDPGRDARGAFAVSDAADVWQQGVTRRAEFLGAATERMLDLAALTSGDRVLDVAAGSGEQSIPAAKRIGPTGSLLAIDVTASMLEAALGAAREAGITTVETRVMDAHHLDLESDSFDAAISRIGIMLFSDQPAALREIHRVLKSGARLSAMVWGPAERNPATSIPTGVIRGLLDEPVPKGGENGMFSLGDADHFADLLRDAGFHGVHVESVALERHYRSLAEAVLLVSESLVTHNLLARLDDVQRDRAMNDIERAFRPFTSGDACVLPGEVHIGMGTK